MALTTDQKRLLNNATPGLATAGPGDIVDSATTTKQGTMFQGVAVADSAAAPTKAEFVALLTSLRNAGHILP